MIRTAATLLLFALLPSGAAAQLAAEAATRTTAPTLEIRAAEGRIRVDGTLDDPGWQGAARVTSFLEFAPNEGVEPPSPTEAVLTYDDANLYVAFIARGDPTQVRASLRNRDEVFNDDHVGILIDPFGQSALGYFILVNPLGVQADLLMSPQGEDDSFDLLFESAGRITEDGYVVEMAIPFRSLRFPDQPVQSWKINLYRNIPRGSRHQIAWSPLARDNSCLLCQNGSLEGIRGVRPGGGIELLPALVASRSGGLADSRDPGSFESADPTAELSLGAKYALPSGWTLEGTLNPDFSQVESDAAQVDVNSTFALFYPERRPFFQEGSDLLDSWVNVAYTRSINAPLVAAKVTGRTGATSVAYLGARDEHSPFILPFEERSAVLQAGWSTSNIFRVRQSLYEGSFLGGMLTDRRLDGGGSGSTGSIDALLRFARVYQIEAQLVGSHTREPEDAGLSEEISRRLGGELFFGHGDERYTAAFDGEAYAGRATHLSLERSGSRWSFELDYRDATPTYRAASGFQTRNDFRRGGVETGLTFYPKTPWLERIAPRVSATGIWNFAGEEKERSVNPGIYLRLPRQTNISVNGRFGEELFRGSRFEGLRRYGVSVNTQPSEALAFGVFYGTNRSIARNRSIPTFGEGADFQASATIRPTQRLVIEPSLVHSALSDPETRAEFYSGYILRNRVSYQFTRELSARVVAQYDDFGEAFDLEPLLVYRLNPFSIFYIGSTHEYSDFGARDGLVGTDRQYFLKFQYLFRP